MSAYASASYSLAAAMPVIDSLSKLRATLQPLAELPLVFIYDDRRIAPGYHVTEVKAAHLSSLDCGANPESWSETVIQLWDVDATAPVHMKAAKFLGILEQVERRVALDADGLLIFECGDSSRPMKVFTVGHISAADGQVTVELAARTATCKPRERGLDAVELPATSGCCSTPKTQTVACCA
jgi:hypothetical protein